MKRWCEIGVCSVKNVASAAVSKTSTSCNLPKKFDIFNMGLKGRLKVILQSLPGIYQKMCKSD